MSCQPPYITEDGELIVPFNCDKKYQWWKTQKPHQPAKRLSSSPEILRIDEILEELRAPASIWAKYTSVPYREPWEEIRQTMSFFTKEF